VIATHSEPSPVWCVVLRLIIANNTAIRIRASFWDIQFLDGETGVPKGKVLPPDWQ
jgi:hypothetical protein